MEDKKVFGMEKDSGKLRLGNDETMHKEMEADELGTGNAKNDIVGCTLEKGETSNGNVVFSREGPLVNEEQSRMFGDGGSGDTAEKLKSRLASGGSVSELGNGEKVSQVKKLKDRIELGRLLKGAVSAQDWALAKSLILLADPQALSDALCILLDLIWFLTTHEELERMTGLLQMIIANGAHDFRRAILRTSFVASCVCACQGQTMTLEDTIPMMTQRLRERMQELKVDAVLKVIVCGNFQKFVEWALECVDFRSSYQGNGDGVNQNSSIQIRLQAFKVILDHVGNHLTVKDFTEALDAACFPLTLFSSSSAPGWASSISGIAVEGLLSMLVNGGADNVNECFLEASRFGCTDLVHILLKIGRRNSMEMDVNTALGIASSYGNISTMECLVEEGHARTFLAPLTKAADRGCLPAVQWFVKRGCQDMELCLALIAAISSSRVETAAFILPLVSHHILDALSLQIVKAAGERCKGSFDGVSFLLKSNFLRDPAATYAVADSISRLDDEAVAPELKKFLLENWSEVAFLDGLRQGQEHYLNLTRILKYGESPIRLDDLPSPLRVAIAYLPLYRECVEAGGCLLSQRLRGQLVEAARRLGGKTLDKVGQGRELLAVLEHYLPNFLL